jgi:hypothetical protein
MSPRRIPKMSHHKASGQAVVRLSGKDYYLGPWGSRTARIEYDRLVAEWLAGARQAPETRDEGLTIVELLARYLDYADGYYRHPDGTLTREILCLKDAFRPLRRLYGHTLAAEFGPLSLKSVRQWMIDAGLCRTNINRRINRIRRLFKWV